MSTSADTNKLIAVFGATGQQGGAVVRALQARGQFRVRALSRNPARHRGLGDEVVEANLDQPDTLKAALRGVHGVFAVTNFWSEGTDERKQVTAADAALLERDGRGAPEGAGGQLETADAQSGRGRAECVTRSTMPRPSDALRPDSRIVHRASRAVDREFSKPESSAAARHGYHPRTRSPRPNPSAGWPV
jgi:hypothetical protein